MNQYTLEKLEQIQKEYEPYRGRFQSPFTYAANHCLHLIDMIQQQNAELEKWKREALQQYPTPDAYEAACKALHKHRERADRAEYKLRTIIDCWQESGNIDPELEQHMEKWLDRIKASQETKQVNQ